MALPKCVRTEFGDTLSRDCLLHEGWRRVQELIVWRGKPRPRKDSMYFTASVKDREACIDLSRKVNWYGRFFLDPQISEADARAILETDLESIDREFLHTAIEDNEVVGFVAFEYAPNIYHPRILLIAVDPLWQKNGIAGRMIRSIRNSCYGAPITAGASRQNRAAQKLYKSLGMEYIKSQAVWHK